MFALVPTEHALPGGGNVLDRLAPIVEGYLEQAAERSFGRYTADDVLTLVREGHWQMWVAFDGDVFDPDLVFVTSIVQYPSARALQIIACAGRRFLKHFAEADATLRRYGKDQGCDIFETFGREAWVKVLGRHGEAYSSAMIEGFL